MCMSFFTHIVFAQPKAKIPTMTGQQAQLGGAAFTLYGYVFSSFDSNREYFAWSRRTLLQNENSIELFCFSVKQTTLYCSDGLRFVV